MTATLIDAIGVLILAYNTLRGLSTGLIRTSVGMMAAILASYYAWQYQDLGKHLVDGWIPPTMPLAFLASPLAVWLIVFGVVNLAGILLRFMIRVTPLVMADRLGGALFGLTTGLVILLTPMLLLASFPLLQQIPLIQQTLAHSLLANALTPLVQVLQHLAPAFPL